jgi:hypothetical protein
MLTAFAAAAQHSPAAYSQELFAAATEFLWEGLGQLEPCGLADVAAAYAAVQHYDDDEDFFNGVAAAALQRLQVGTLLRCLALHTASDAPRSLPQLAELLPVFITSSLLQNLSTEPFLLPAGICFDCCMPRSWP